MPRGENQKKKLILILRYLQQKSDEDHPVSMSRLIEYLESEGISAERKSIYDRNIARLEKQIERKDDLIERLLNTYLPTNSAAAE